MMELPTVQTNEHASTKPFAFGTPKRFGRGIESIDGFIGRAP
jgi:hypothetical protein